MYNNSSTHRPTTGWAAEWTIVVICNDNHSSDEMWWDDCENDDLLLLQQDRHHWWRGTTTPDIGWSVAKRMPLEQLRRKCGAVPVLWMAVVVCSAVCLSDWCWSIRTGDECLPLILLLLLYCVVRGSNYRKAPERTRGKLKHSIGCGIKETKTVFIFQIDVARDGCRTRASSIV